MSARASWSLSEFLCLKLAIFIYNYIWAKSKINKHYLQVWKYENYTAKKITLYGVYAIDILQFLPRCLNYLVLWFNKQGKQLTLLDERVFFIHFKTYSLIKGISYLIHFLNFLSLTNIVIWMTFNWYQCVPFCYVVLLRILLFNEVPSNKRTQTQFH